MFSKNPRLTSNNSMTICTKNNKIFFLYNVFSISPNGSDSFSLGVNMMKIQHSLIASTTYQALAVPNFREKFLSKCSQFISFSLVIRINSVIFSQQTFFFSSGITFTGTELPKITQPRNDIFSAIFALNQAFVVGPPITQITFSGTKLPPPPPQSIRVFNFKLFTTFQARSILTPITHLVNTRPWLENLPADCAFLGFEHQQYIASHHYKSFLNPDYCEMARKRLSQVELPLEAFA